MTREELRKYYLDAAEGFSAKAVHEDKILLYLSVLRLVCFAGGIFTVIYSFTRSSVAGLLTSVLLACIFLLLLKIFSDHSGKKEFAGNMALINNNEAQAVAGDISRFKDGSRYIDQNHDFSWDVDLFGDHSLFQYLNRTITGYGSDILATWLSDPYELRNETVIRQEIVKELSVKSKWRQEFMATGMHIPYEKNNADGLLKWIDESAEEFSFFRKALIIVLPSTLMIVLLLVITGVLNYYFFILLFLLNLFITGFSLKKTNRIHNTLTGNHLYLTTVRQLMDLFNVESFSSPALAEMKDQLAGSRLSAAVAIMKLSRLIRWFDSRLNIIVGFLLNGMLLWDFQCVHQLNRWKKEYRPFFRLWLETIGKVDAFSSLGNFAFNNPAFSYPVNTDQGMIFSARSLGHPLIDEDRRIPNDFNLGEKGRICIITGANMAGKSTFLRTVAVNYILAMTGSPVCASELIFTPVRLFTSMRTTDSLSGNESYFYAELKRLKTLKSRIIEGHPVFFILDEILKGTNSADKSLGSKLFLKSIISSQGTGLIATHDTSLGELEKDHPDNIYNMCFEIEIEGESIYFDYKLGPGITKRMNAALLMRQMGILD